ncbi:hypothetical protein [Pseudalkalibacillus salsuginis]|uniref:hypothetical protein n=1 Tax=Pseudalkalibacillus salsuginis TaxID=2910972 RepID=UPI001F2D2001|nr:hypothetical protein [Pseudalkalibacillus salsuginis]MCF6409313.1 hypothetical protein [Pseudalkalibacillus salsuginis]
MSNSEWDYDVGYSGWGEWVPRLPISTDPEDVTKMKHSAKSFLRPARDLQGFLEAVAEKKGFAQLLKKAAELNENEKVDNLIKSTGVVTDFTTNLTPDGIRITFQPDDTAACFHITLSLCW